MAAAVTDAIGYDGYQLFVTAPGADFSLPLPGGACVRLCLVSAAPRVSLVLS